MHAGNTQLPSPRQSKSFDWLPTFTRLRGFIWASNLAIRAGGLPEIGVYFKGGLGDDIMRTAVAHELKRRGVRKVWQFTFTPELHEGNPDLVAVPHDFRLLRLCGLFGIPCIELGYPDNPPRHIIAMMCERAGIRGDVSLRPHVFLTDQERKSGKLGSRPQIVIQTSNLGASYPMRNKLWPPERFQVVADALNKDFEIIQLGLSGDPLLSGAKDLRGKTSVREAAAILASSQLFLGLVTGMMHLARAVDCRSVIIYGGREHPWQSGYGANENLFWTGACAPCWLRNDCDFERVCMQEIMPDRVIAAVRRQADLHGTPLPVDHVTVPE